VNIKQNDLCLQSLGEVENTEGRLEDPLVGSLLLQDKPVSDCDSWIPSIGNRMVTFPALLVIGERRNLFAFCNRLEQKDTN
jgi:hypothetical protein